MGLMDWLRQLLGGQGGRAAAVPPSQPRFGLDELARRLEVDPFRLRAVQVLYHSFRVPKRSGGTRVIHAPDAALKALQRTILRRLLARLGVHPCATGFRRGSSIVTNALPHVGKAAIVKMDIENFFPATRADRVRDYFRWIGWDDEAAAALAKVCTHEGGLPQGAPTSPILSNVVNYRLDARLAGFGFRVAAAYTRYADDITFSFPTDDHQGIQLAIRMTKSVLAEYGYRLHHGPKLRIARRADRQVVTGLVVNDRVNLPRQTRRWLRAVAHHAATGRQPTLTDEQLAGWRALQHMVATQAGGDAEPAP